MDHFDRVIKNNRQSRYRNYTAVLDVSHETFRKDSARHIAGVNKRRGKLIPQPCEVCGTTDRIEMHHDDHGQPLKVRWLCPGHHRHVH